MAGPRSCTLPEPGDATRVMAVTRCESVDDPKQDLPQGIDRRTFTVVKRGGFDQREVQVYLEDLEQAFRDLELWAQRTRDRLTLAELEVERARHAENAAVENAMSAVFDAKDRILQRAHEEAGRIEARALSGEGEFGTFSPLTGDEAERLRHQAEQMLADAERRADAMIAAAELRLTEARRKSAEAEAMMQEAREAAAVVGGDDSTWAAAAQHEMVKDLRRRLEAAEERIVELEASKTPDQLAIERANEEAEAIIAAAQRRSSELLAQAQAAMTMPGGEAIANAEERAASIIAEAEARARQIEEAATGITSQAESEVQSVRDEAERLQVEAERARARASETEGKLAEAEASFARARAEAEELRAQLSRARSEIDHIRSSPAPVEPPAYPPAPPVTMVDAAGGIVGGAADEPTSSRPALEAVPPPEREMSGEAAPQVDVDGTVETTARRVAERDRHDETPPEPRRDVVERPVVREPVTADDVDDEDGLSASERLRIAAQKMRRESGIEDDGAPMAGQGSRYERRSAGLPRIGATGSDFGGLRSRLSGDARRDDDDDDD